MVRKGLHKQVVCAGHHVTGFRPIRSSEFVPSVRAEFLMISTGPVHRAGRAFITGIGLG